MMTTTFLGTELKLNIRIDPIGDMTMDDYDFDVELYCSTKRILSFKKPELKRLDSNNYIVTFDTKEIGSGELKCNIVAHIPDSDFVDGVRTEVVKMSTGLKIKDAPVPKSMLM